MKRVERHLVKGPLYKHFDLERKTAKQAEAILGQRLQRLEEICLYHVKLLTREQRQLQRELQRLQQDIIKKKLSSYFGNGIQKRPDALKLASQAGQKSSIPRAAQTRTLATHPTPETHAAESQRSPSHRTGPKDSTKTRERRSQNDRADSLGEETPQAPGEACMHPPEGGDPSVGTSALCHVQGVSTHTTEVDSGSSPAGDSRMACVNETGSEGANLKPGRNAGKQIPPDPVKHADGFKGESTKLTFLELLTKVKNARYLRHRVPPESERLLSVAEIFGHEESSPRRAPSKSLL
ncbi:coiled-coil domain-containing protein 190 [Ochotona curzoniae]|uniref:coiled-coil domain-containing protein 190 n=1 Tax=Ochotona curzoniae TaxID=130825 RepID=UPI001B348A0B|nr:coiled-coil domain-containing protein 190 [Ochotona curzoniae]